jgi:isopentenyl diphosphate isomerase/L-lactate dehydrogenase-like FMN-dependent dehydrogenase
VSQTRLPRREELVNVLEFEESVQLALDPAVYSTIAGGNRAGFDRITFRPRMLVPTLDLDMSVELVGEKHFTPIVVGPVGQQRRYHPEGELATLNGAAAARTPVVVSSRSSVPIAELAAQTKTQLWYSVYAADADARRQIEQAVGAGCKAIWIASEAGSPPNWKRIEVLRRGLSVPFVIKGVTTVKDARTAIEEGAHGVVVSDHGGAAAAGATTIDVLPSITDACGGKTAVLVDGGFRRGSDIAKALALGARGVLVARPAMWGLAAYGADGVQNILEMLQEDLARNMGALGAPNLQSLTREMVRLHRR